MNILLRLVMNPLCSDEENLDGTGSCLFYKLIKRNALCSLFANLVDIDAHWFFAQTWNCNFGIIDSDSFTKWQKPFIVH